MEKENSHIENDVFLAQWLERAITDSDLKKLVSEEDFVAYKKMRLGIDSYAGLESPVASSLEKVKATIERRKMTKVRKLRSNWVLAAAASLVLFLGFYFVNKNGTTQIETSFSEQKTIALLDGSEVILNAKSNIDYNASNWLEKRHLNLNGEAFFKVAKGKSFVVETNNGSVAVLGTQFNVRATSDYFEVVCYEGKVRVQSQGQTQILGPGMAFRKINGNDNEDWVTDNSQPTWLLGESSFKSVPLKYVLKALEQQYDLEIDANSIDDTALFTGSFPHDNDKIALSTVLRPMGLRYRNGSSNTIILTKME